MEARLDGTYTRLLIRVQNISWRSHPTKAQIYGDLPTISSIVTARRVCLRADNELISSLLLWTPNGARRSRKLSYPDVIARDVGIDKRDLDSAMRDRDFWRTQVDSIISTAVER